MLKLVSFHIQAHLNAFLHILKYFSQSFDVDGLNLLEYSVFELFSIVRAVFLYTLPFNRPQRKKWAGVRSGDPGGQRFFEIILSFKKTFNFSHARI